MAKPTRYGRIKKFMTPLMLRRSVGRLRLKLKFIRGGISAHDRVAKVIKHTKRQMRRIPARRMGRGLKQGLALGAVGAGAGMLTNKYRTGHYFLKRGS